jgi:hypothetical protein
MKLRHVYNHIADESNDNEKKDQENQGAATAALWRRAASPPHPHLPIMKHLLLLRLLRRSLCLLRGSLRRSLCFLRGPLCRLLPRIRKSHGLRPFFAYFFEGLTSLSRLQKLITRP